jgi:hypothetical protein
MIYKCNFIGPFSKQDCFRLCPESGKAIPNSETSTHSRIWTEWIDLVFCIMSMENSEFSTDFLLARSQATREANPPPSPPPPLPPCLCRAAAGAGPLGTTRGASKEGGGGASPLSPLLSHSGRRPAEFYFFVLGSRQRPATAVGRHSCRSGRGPSSVAKLEMEGGGCRWAL